MRGIRELNIGKGKCYGIIDAFDTDPVLLHRDQFNRAGDDSFCLGLAKGIIHGKINNSLVLLRRQARRQSNQELAGSVSRLAALLQKIKSAQTLDELRGYEGSAARSYFQGIASFLDGDWRFSGRKKRPPPDPVNAMLSYGYTLLYYNIYLLFQKNNVRNINYMAVLNFVKCLDFEQNAYSRTSS